MVKSRKKYSDWNIKDVFKDILGQLNYESLGNMPRFNFDELLLLKHSFIQEEINKFFGELKSHLKNIQNELTMSSQLASLLILSCQLQFLMHKNLQTTQYG